MKEPPGLAQWWHLLIVMLLGGAFTLAIWMFGRAWGAW